MGIIKIDRSIAFSPEDFFGTEKWCIEEMRGDSVTEIDLSEITYINQKRYSLDIYVFKTIWLNKDLIPKKWEERNNNGEILCYGFSGTLFRYKNTHDGFILYIYFDYHYEWRYDFFWIGEL